MRRLQDFHDKSVRKVPHQQLLQGRVSEVGAEEAQEDAEEQRQYRQVLTQNSEVQNLFLVLNLQQQLHGIQRAPRSF